MIGGETRKGHADSSVLGLVALAGLLPTELLLLTLSFDGAALADVEGWPAQALIHARLLPQLLTVGVGALLAVYAPRLPSFERRLVGAFHTHPQRRFYLLGHLAAFGSLFALSRIVFGDGRADPPWPISWALAAALTLIFWLSAIAPPRFWTAQLAGGRRVLSVGAAIAASAVLAGRFTERYWETFASATFEFSRYLLSLFYDGVTASAATRTIRLEGFGVQIAPDCSGLEGIGLVAVFLAAYLWFFRDRHRFPHSLLLFPIGAATIWIVNALRIAVLIVVGAELSPAIAVQGFHSQAGWIGFTIVSLGIVALAGRIPFFLKVTSPRAVGRDASDTPPYLVPVMALLAATMLTGALAAGVDWLYPVRIVAAGSALFWFRNSYRRFVAAPSWSSVGIGIAVFVGWVALEPLYQDGGGLLADGLASMSNPSAGVWLAVRVLGSVIVIPIVEELAFRGYLIRRLTNADFEGEPFTPLALIPVLLSSLAFGLLHGRWIAGTLAGLAYAWALHRRGELADPIAAHMTTNGLIAVAVLLGGWWGLWA